nr:MAG TPA: hypothetical protein [Caudoviricetes sp.]
MQAAYYVRDLVLLNDAVTIRHSTQVGTSAIRFPLVVRCCQSAIAVCIVRLSGLNVKLFFENFQVTAGTFSRCMYPAISGVCPVLHKGGC